MIESNQNNGSAENVKTGAVRLSPLAAARDKLKAAGLRVTRPRLAILGALIARDAPATIEVLHGDVGAGRCDLVTVYRCMAAFEEIGLVRRAFLPGGACLYEINLGGPARYHVVCRKTRQVGELDAESAREVSAALGGVEERLRALGYADVGHFAGFFGTAPQPKTT